jgi:hypothetical protein
MVLQLLDEIADEAIEVSTGPARLPLQPLIEDGGLPLQRIDQSSDEADVRNGTGRQDPFTTGSGALWGA